MGGMKWRRWKMVVGHLSGEGGGSRADRGLGRGK